VQRLPWLLLTRTAIPKEEFISYPCHDASTETSFFRLPVNEGKTNSCGGDFESRQQLLKKEATTFFFLTIKEATTLSMDLLIPVACVTMLHAVRAWASWKLPFSQLTNKCKLGTVNHRAGTMFKDLLCVTIQKQM